MQHALKPYATAGVAIVGASMIAATPLVAPPSIPAMPDVTLTASDAWTDVQNTAAQNLSQLINNYNLAPGIAFQQFAANVNGYAQQLLDDPSNITEVTAQIRHNLDGLLTGFTLSNPSDETLATVLSHTLFAGDQSTFTFGWYDLFVGPLASIVGGMFPADMVPIIHMLSSPLSGIIMGSVGPLIAPMVALLNSITDHDSFGDTLANMYGASLNGATLNLDSMLPLINQVAGSLLPAGLGITHVDIAFGGLLTAGDVAIDPYQVAGPGGALIDATPAVGGSILNSVGLSLSGVPVLGNLDLESHAIGPIGAIEAWGQTAGALMGSGWDGKGAVPVAPPLSHIDVPELPSDPGTADALQDMLTALGG